MEKQKKTKRKGLLVAGILAAVLIVYLIGSLWISANYLKVNDFSADFKRGSGQIRAVVISDLHDHQFGTQNEKLVKKIKEQQPDLILMDGDMLNNTSDNSDIPTGLIRSLAEVAPVYYALGNHENDYMEQGHKELTEELTAAGAVVLDKTYVDLDVNGLQIRLGGMYDYAFGLNGNNDALSAPQDTLSFLNEFQNTDRLKIMLAHRPDSFIFGDASKVWDIDLVISGHNHGGQIVLPFLGGIYGGDQGWFPEYVHGMYEKDQIRLFVTSGLGTQKEKLPRFNNPPEIAVLTIK